MFDVKFSDINLAGILYKINQQDFIAPPDEPLRILPPEPSGISARNLWTEQQQRQRTDRIVAEVSPPFAHLPPVNHTGREESNDQEFNLEEYLRVGVD